MKRQDIIMLLVTFVVGTLVGSYLYIYGFSPQYAQIATWTDEGETFELTGEAYGGCSRGGGICGSFQIMGDGAFREFSDVRAGEQRVVSEGMLSNAISRALRQTFTSKSLVEFEEPVVGGRCQSQVDGVDYRVRVRLEGEQFILDTCTTALANAPKVRDLIETAMTEMVRQ